MVSSEALNELILCPDCRGEGSEWVEGPQGFRCRRCDFQLLLEDGVLRLGRRHQSAAVDYYEHTGGPHFIGARFEQDIAIYCSTRAYTRMLDGWFARAEGSAGTFGTLLDLGCGDGRFCLWALERGFRRVVALDASLPALKRLAAEARSQGLDGLVPICAAFEDRCLVPGAFDVALLFEALYYLSDPGAFEEGLRDFLGYIRPGGKAVVAEFSRHGRVLADVVAMNIENMRKLAYEHMRLEKFGNAAVAVRHFTPEELEKAYVEAGFVVRDRGGISPIPMLFQFAYAFTSYPLRPALDDEMRRLLETLDDQSSSFSGLSRNVVSLLERPTAG